MADMESLEQLLEDVINYRGDVSGAIGELRLDVGEDAGQHVLTVRSALAATILFQNGTISVDDCRSWARFILGRRDVLFQRGHEYELLEFLEDWSFPDVGGAIDTSSISTWQDRFSAM